MSRSEEPPRMTVQTLAVLRAMLDEPSGLHYGVELARQTGLRSGTLYPILLRLLRAGMIEDEWENIDPAVAGRRPRRYYRLTGIGARQASAALADAAALLGPASPPGESRQRAPRVRGADA